MMNSGKLERLSPAAQRTGLEWDAMLGLYNWLWTHRLRLQPDSLLPFPDTVIYEHFVAHSWFTYQTSTHSVEKLPQKGCSTEAIFEAMTRHAEHEVVAEFRWRQEASGEVHVLFLDKPGLYRFLGRPRERGVLQRFLAPHGPANTGISVTWTPF
eukprot:RCo043077